MSSSPASPSNFSSPAWCDPRLGLNAACLVAGVGLEDAHIFWSVFVVAFTSIGVGLFGKLVKRSNFPSLFSIIRAMGFWRAPGRTVRFLNARLPTTAVPSLFLAIRQLSLFPTLS